jgi:uncharacterized YigZ family protein
MDAYLTPAAEGEAIYKSKGSKFLGFLLPIKDEHEARTILLDMRKDTRFRGACHFCYAWVLGTDVQSGRSSDDGEPSGTAGKPILQQLEDAGLTQCMLVVVRFFGGVLLGTGLLKKSYRETARLTINNTQIKSVLLFTFFKLHFPAEQQPMVEKAIRDCGAKVEEYGFSEYPVWRIGIKPSLSGTIEDTFKRLDYLGISIENYS